MGFLMALKRDFGATPGFREDLGFGVVSGDLGPQKAFDKAFCANSLFVGRCRDMLLRVPFPPSPGLRVCKRWFPNGGSSLVRRANLRAPV